MTMMSTYKSIVVLVLMAALASCGSTRTIMLEGQYPVPAVGKLPLTIGVYLDQGLQNFTYTEKNDSNGKDELIVNSGSTQQEMFARLLPAVFENVVILDTLEDLPGRYAQIDAVFVPVIEDFQLGLPAKTRLASYEVWIKYNMRLSELNGDTIADWVMTAYGKSPGNNSDREGINDAANQALRDLAATFSLGVTKVPDVRDWLDQKGINN